MDRDRLISQVKQEYATLATKEDTSTIMDGTTGETTAEAYYEELLGKVISGIAEGKFDRFHSGTQVVEAVAKNKDKWLG